MKNSGAIKTAAKAMLIAAAAMHSLPPAARGQDLAPVILKEPNKKRGLPFMETLSVKASAVEWPDAELSIEDLSDLLWAANGINRPGEKKYTASSAMNAHDVDLYVFMKRGVYIYDADRHALNPVLAGDFREEILKTPPRPPAPGAPAAVPRPAPYSAPAVLVLISDSSRFKTGAPERKYEWGAIDAGIVSQNISLFCAATGLKTRPRASMDKEKIKELLKLKDAQNIFLNHPVGYAK